MLVCISAPGVQLGGAEVVDPDKMIAKAVELAKDADAVIAIVGLSAGWELEGHDRTTLALPGCTNELVSKGAAANPNTIVVTQAVCHVPEYTFETTVVSVLTHTCDNP
jgi:beta-glucosidase